MDMKVHGGIAEIKVFVFKKYQIMKLITACGDEIIIYFDKFEDLSNIGTKIQKKIDETIYGSTAETKVR